MVEGKSKFIPSNIHFNNILTVVDTLCKIEIRIVHTKYHWDDLNPLY